MCEPGGRVLHLAPEEARGRRAHPYSGQQPRGNPQVVAPLDVVLDAPVDRVNGSAGRIHSGLHPRALPRVKPVVVAGVAKDVGQGKGEQVA